MDFSTLLAFLNGLSFESPDLQKAFSYVLRQLKWAKRRLSELEKYNSELEKEQSVREYLGIASESRCKQRISVSEFLKHLKIEFRAIKADDYRVRFLLVVSFGKLQIYKRCDIAISEISQLCNVEFSLLIINSFSEFEPKIEDAILTEIVNSKAKEV